MSVSSRWRWPAYLAGFGSALVITPGVGAAAAVPSAAATRAAVPSAAATRVAVPSAAANRAAARREAQRLLTTLTLPAPRVALSAEPRGDRGALRVPGSTLAEEKLVDVPAFWRLRLPASAVLDGIAAHPPRGATRTTSGIVTGPSDTVWWETYSWPVVGPRLGTRQLTVALTTLADGETGVRADAQVVWIVPRPATERVPAGVRTIAITRDAYGATPALSLSVTGPGRIARIETLLDRLPTVQPGAWSCPAQPTPVPIVALRFRSASGGVLARASEDATVTEPTTPCDPLGFSIRGRPKTPLLGGAAFLGSVSRLLGRRLGLTATS